MTKNGIFFKSLEIKNFKGISSAKIDLRRDYNLIVGKNGAGKTSILQAIAASYSEILRHAYGVSSPINFKNMVKLETEVASLDSEIVFAGRSYHLQFEIDERNGLRIGSRTLNNNIGTQEFSHLIQDIRDSKRESTGLLYFYDQNRFNEHGNPPGRPSTSNVSPYKQDNFVISHFSRWFDNRDAEEAREIRRRSDLDYKDPQLEAARKAILKATGFEKVYYSSEENEGVTVEKNKYAISFNMLSSGEKSILVLLGDITRRCGLINSRDPFSVGGVTLIDEIAAHLHPSWQRSIISILIDFFPNMQFVISTHSPQVLGEIEADNIIFLDHDGHSLAVKKISRETLGQDSNFILNAVLGSSERTLNLKKMLSDIEVAIAKKDILKAQSLVTSIENRYGKSLAELTVIKMRIKRLENS